MKHSGTHAGVDTDLPLDLFLRFDFPPVRSILRLFRNMAILFHLVYPKNCKKQQR